MREAGSEGGGGREEGEAVAGGPGWCSVAVETPALSHHQAPLTSTLGNTESSVTLSHGPDNRGQHHHSQHWHHPPTGHHWTSGQTQC